MTEQLAEIVEDGSDYVEKIIDLSALPMAKRYILREEIKAFISESPRVTAATIAKRAGVAERTVYEAHNDVRFIAAMNRFSSLWYEGQAAEVLKAIVKGATVEGKTSSQKLYMETTGRHVTRIQTQNVNVNTTLASLDADKLDTDEGLRRFLILYASKGYTLQQIIDVWQDLKSTQAFG